MIFIEKALKLYFFTIQFLLLLTPALSHAEICNDLMNNAKHALRTNLELQLEWKALFVREPEVDADTYFDQDYFETYVRTASEAGFSDFLPWFESNTKLDFPALLSNMRQTIIFGKEGQPLFPSSFSPPASLYLGFYFGSKGTWYEASKAEFRVGSLSMPVHSKFFDKTKELIGDSFAKTLAKDEPLIIDGISSQYWPKNKYFDESTSTYNHIYPKADGQGLQEYSSIAGALLTEIRDRFYTLSDDELISKVAKYYYISTNAHFFSRINNSVLMTQVNFILLKKGLAGTSHGYLDFAAISCQFETFLSVFRAVLNLR